MGIFSFLLPKEMNVKYCPECKSFNVHRSFKGAKRNGALGVLMAPGLKCFDCGYFGLLFPEEKVQIKKK